MYDLSKNEQIRILKNLGVGEKEINILSIEANRVNMILRLRDKNIKEV